MINITINNKTVQAEAGSTLLQAAENLNITIPTMCYLDNHTHYTSCMLCVVKDLKNEKMLPACSVKAEEGMEIETDSEEVHQARRTALELLLSEHIGDCESPCRQTCPADMNIPLALKQIEAGELRQAIITIKNHIALHAILSRICPAPCEKGCRRKQIDRSISICKLMGFVAEEDLNSDSPYLPAIQEKSDKKVAIIGAGPAGLSAAWHLLQKGYSCTIFDDHPEPGGKMRYNIPEDKLPRSLLTDEINLIKLLGAKFRMNTKVGDTISAISVIEKYHAVILAVGSADREFIEQFGLKKSDKGIQIDKNTFQTEQKKIFACGSLISATKMAVKSLAQGRQTAISADQFLNGQKFQNKNKKFNSRIGKLMDSEKEYYLQQSPEITTNILPAEISDITKEQAANEAALCLHCECLKPDNCKLRNYSDEYDAKQSHFRGDSRKELVKVREHSSVVYEPGKCIKCGLCVKITEKAGEKLGLTFIGRGFDVKIGVPLNESLDKGLTKTAEKCVEACPTGALAFRNDHR